MNKQNSTPQKNFPNNVIRHNTSQINNLTLDEVFMIFKQIISVSGTKDSILSPTAFIITPIQCNAALRVKKIS